MTTTTNSMPNMFKVTDRNVRATIAIHLTLAGKARREAMRGACFSAKPELALASRYLANARRKRIEAEGGGRSAVSGVVVPMTGSEVLKAREVARRTCGSRPARLRLPFLELA